MKLGKALFEEVSFGCSRLITKSYSTSFSHGIRSLDKRFHKPIYAIYGYVRLADEIVDSFHDFARILPPAEVGGRLLIAHEGGHRREISAGLRCGVATFGFSPSSIPTSAHGAFRQVATGVRRCVSHQLFQAATSSMTTSIASSTAYGRPSS